jgi:hypothetical protein
VSQQIFSEMIERFKDARTSIKLEEGAARHSAYITDTNTERVGDMILQKRRVIIDEVTHQLQISHGQPMKLSTTGLPSIMSAQLVPEKLRISQRETSGHLQTAFGSLWC